MCDVNKYVGKLEQLSLHVFKHYNIYIDNIIEYLAYPHLGKGKQYNTSIEANNLTTNTKDTTL